MSRVLFVAWDGAGNLVPTLGLAQRLSRRGHDVRVLGHRSIDARRPADGWRFRSFHHAPDFDACARRGPDDMAGTAGRIWFDEGVCRDLADELAREPADAIVCDCMLFGGLSAALASGVPVIALFHAAFTPFRQGPFFDLLTMTLPRLNAIRAGLGMDAVARVSDVHDACALSLVAAPREFEPPIDVPANVRFAGPFLDAPPRMTEQDGVPVEPDGRPLILVSFSTSDQGQTAALQRVSDALAHVEATAIVTTGPAVDPASLRTPDNVRAVQFVPHAELLPRAALVVTHAGLGTVMAGLAHGVPLVCLPFGRDQFFNAGRVAAMEAGTTLRADADAATIAETIRKVLADDRIRRGARRAGDAIARYKDGEDALAEVEALASAGRAAICTGAGGAK